MNKVTRILTITGIMVSLFLVGVTASMGANINSVSTVNATATSPLFTSVEVTSTKEISNVVMLFCNMTVQKVEEGGLVQDFVAGLGLWTATVSGSGEFEGLAIMSVWVKSGSFRSGDGSGYGGMIAFSGTCGVEVPQ